MKLNDIVQIWNNVSEEMAQIHIAREFPRWEPRPQPSRASD